jgi:hypothetical protein
MLLIFSSVFWRNELRIAPINRLKTQELRARVTILTRSGRWSAYRRPGDGGFQHANRHRH